MNVPSSVVSDGVDVKEPNKKINRCLTVDHRAFATYFGEHQSSGVEPSRFPAAGSSPQVCHVLLLAGLWIAPVVADKRATTSSRAKDQ